jgi:hypothetical protein
MGALSQALKSETKILRIQRIERFYLHVLFAISLL